MPKFFLAFDRLKPFFNIIDRATLFVCKLLLIADIGITFMAVTGRYISFVPDPAWSEEIVLLCMTYMCVLSAAIAIRHNRHIRMSALDKWLPKALTKSLDLLADAAVLTFGIIMLWIGMRYALLIGSRGFFTSLPTVSKFWKYFPIPLAGLSMIIFEIETIVKHIRAFYEKDTNPETVPAMPVEDEVSIEEAKPHVDE